MKKLVFLFFFISVFILSTSPAQSQTIILKTGKIIEGKIIEQTNTAITVELFGIPVTYPLDTVKSIDGKKLIPFSPKKSLPENPAVHDEKKNMPLPKKETENPHYMQGLTYLKNNQWDEAIAAFDKAILTSPRDAEIYLARGRSYKEKGDYDRAIADYTKAITITPFSEKAYLYRGITCVMTNILGRALSDFNRAIEINPRYAAAYYNRGIFYHRQGKYPEAIADYSHVLELDPNADTYLNRGTAQFEIGLVDEAIADYNKALKIKPDFFSVHFNKALACQKAGRIKDAITAYKNFLLFAPPSEKATRELAKEKIEELRNGTGIK